MAVRAGSICAVALATAACALAQETAAVPDPLVTVPALTPVVIRLEEEISTARHKPEAKDVLNLEVESGETYYVQASISMGVVAGHSNLAPSTNEVFEGMKAKLKDNTGKDLDPPKEAKK